jgi:hypothetical protein
MESGDVRSTIGFDFLLDYCGGRAGAFRGGNFS